MNKNVSFYPVGDYAWEWRKYIEIVQDPNTFVRRKLPQYFLEK